MHTLSRKGCFTHPESCKIATFVKGDGTWSSMQPPLTAKVLFCSVFISYRAASELPLARILFDELNRTVTPGGHRVTVYWDAHRLVKVAPPPSELLRVLVQISHFSHSRLRPCNFSGPLALLV